MVAYTLSPLPVVVSNALSAKFANTWVGIVAVAASVLPVSALDALVTELPTLAVPASITGSFALPNGLKGTATAGATLTGSVGSPYSVATSNVVEVAVLATVAPAAAAPEGFRLVALLGAVGSTVLAAAEVVETIPLLDTLGPGADSNQVLATVAPSLVGLTYPLLDTRRSPAMVIFDGSNAIARTTNDSTLNGSATFTVACLFDPELVEVGQTGVLVAKHNATDTQAGWRMEWDATTGEVTVRVCTSADGTTDFVERTTNVGTASDGTVGIRKREIVVFTYASAAPTLHLYVNGSTNQQVQADTGTPGAPNGSSEPFSVACEEPTNGGANFSKGAVYLVAFWDVVLNATDVAKIDRAGQLHEDVVTADLLAAWTPARVNSNLLTDRYYGWKDEINDWDLNTLVANANLWIVPNLGSLPYVRRNTWDTDFFDSESIRTDNLTSTRVLSSDAPNRRLYNVAHSNPNIADVSDWRTANGDLTILIAGVKPAGANSVVLFECHGLELIFDRPSQTITLTLGLDNAGAGTPNEAVVYTTSASGIGEGRTFNLVFRYNCDDDRGVLFLGGRKHLELSRTPTNDFQNRDGLELCGFVDFIATIAVPACLSDEQVENLLLGFAPPVDSSNIIGGQRFRYIPVVQEGLSQIFADYPASEYNEQAQVSLPIPSLSFGELVLANQPDDGDTFVLDDGFNPAVTFEFDDNSSVAPTPTLRQVAIAVGDLDGTLINLSNAINNAPTLDMTSQHVPQSDNVDVTATRGEYDGGSPYAAITHPVNVSTNLSATGFSNGLLIEWNHIPQRAMLAPSINDSFAIAEWNYVDKPYPVQEPEPDDGGDIISPIFGDPLPSVVSVTVSTTGHNVTAIANAGSTDAGQVISYWEVELSDGNTEVIAVADYNGNNSFSVNRNHTDAFTIPVGQNWKDKRIRFVIQAVADGTQVWKSLFLRMEADGFDNSETTTIIIPGAGAESPLTVDDLIVTVQQRDFAVLQEEASAAISVRVDEDSRYKLSKVFLDGSLSIGPEFDLMSVIDDFYRVGSAFRTHRVREADLGSLDRLAVQFYGPGNEKLWWVIAYANAIVDPEDLIVGQALVIPSRERVREFIARRPQRASL